MTGFNNRFPHFLIWIGNRLRVELVFIQIGALAELRPGF